MNPQKGNEILDLILANNINTVSEIEVGESLENYLSQNISS